MSKYQEYQKKYRKECQDELIKAGFAPTITPEQAELVLMPSHGPENFYCDGEVTHAVAFADWKRNLRNLNMKESEVKKAVKYIFG